MRNPWESMSPSVSSVGAGLFVTTAWHRTPLAGIRQFASRKT